MTELFYNIFIFIINFFGIIYIMEKMYNFILNFNNINLINSTQFYNRCNSLIEEIETNFMDVAWQIFRIYGKIHILSNNYIIKPFNYYIYSPSTKLFQYFIKDDCIVFVKDGEEILSYNKKSNIITKDISEYDFILFYPKNQKIMILDNINDIPDINEIDHSILETNVGFMCCQILVELFNKEYISRTFNINEFCVNSNKILDNSFIKWYCNKNFSDVIKINEIKNYHINLIDNDVNELTLKNDEFILIDKKSYKIYKNKINSNDESKEDDVKEDENENENENEDEDENENENEDANEVEDENEDEDENENENEDENENENENEDENEETNENDKKTENDKEILLTKDDDVKIIKENFNDNNNTDNLSYWNFDIKYYLGFSDNIKSKND